MELLSSAVQFCTCCMEEHEVKTVLVKEETVFKGVPIKYDAIYLYCSVAQELYENEDLIRKNDIAMKDAYRKQVGLLTSGQIIAIREKYNINQSDLCLLLGWGGKTIARYESHHIQDKAHDSILKKIDQDPEWYIYLLNEVKDSLTQTVYNKYLHAATELYENQQDDYLRKTINAQYACFQNQPMLCGNTLLSLNKVVDVIRYFSSAKNVTNLYKVKLMKLLWYADALSYKRRGRSITGLVYQALKWGAVPIGHDFIIRLKDVPCEEIDWGNGPAYYFSQQYPVDCLALTKEEREILDIVIEKLGSMPKDELVNFMHEEQAYKMTPTREIISFEYTEKLKI